MKELKFEKGQFITQDHHPAKSFAIFEGLLYDKTNQDDPDDYSLLCYYNPLHYTQDSEGNLKAEPVFECDYEDENGEYQECSYSVEDRDFVFWRVCSEDEKIAALKFLAEKKRLAYDEKTFKFRRLKDNERISFEEPKSTGHAGGNVTYNRGSEVSNPYYGRGRTVPTPVSPATSNKKYITRVVNDNWEQKEPVETMSLERKTLIELECSRLGYAFSAYSTTYGTRYPTSGSEIPIRQPASAIDYCGWPDINYCGWDIYED